MEEQANEEKETIQQNDNDGAENEETGSATISAIVPQLKGDHITEEELKTAVRVLTAVAKLNSRKRKKNNNTENGDNDQEDGLELYKKSNLRPLRKALAGCLELHRRTMFQGKSEEEHFEQRRQERTLKRQKMAERDLHKKYIADTALRRGRIEKLNKFKEEAKDEEEQKLLAMMIPDGHVDSLPNQKQQQPKMLKENVDNVEDKMEEDEPNIKLPKLRSCYVCKVRYRDLHHFYDQLCPACASFNWEKRHQSADMSNRVAVVTGSRVKIGYQTCLKLLRAGATVVATTRFPNAAAEVYRKEPDFEQWKNRLQIYGLDLRDVTGLEAFTRFLKMTYSDGIDVLINNACQTIRRPRGFYVPMVEKEQTLWKEADDTHKSLLQGCMQFENIRRKLHHDHHGKGQKALTGNGSEDSPLLLMGMETDVQPDENDSVMKDEKPAAVDVVTVTEKPANGSIANQTSHFETSGLSHSAAMSQMIILPEDVGVSNDVLPPGLTDINGQQLDLRRHNSWLLKMEEVSTPEVMECMFINAIAPFVLNSRLKPLMAIPNDESRPDRYIINVSAMEGKFYRYKMPNHPHTNMAKAALNMMTRTSAEDFAEQHRIFMNSVDTGWINDENPLEKASKTAANNLFQTPIDEVDAAARILDPVFSGVNGGRESEKEYGKFLKDYRETEW